MQDEVISSAEGRAPAEAAPPAEPLLTPLEARIIGCLIEKEISTPDVYPLTLRALTAACNQKSNREPTMSVAEATVQEALDVLRYRKTLVSAIHEANARVVKFRHHLASHVPVDDAEAVVMCELLLRGPQTAGELRTRGARLRAFDSVAAVETVLQGLMDREPEPFVVRLPPSAGQYTPRYAHTWCGRPAVATVGAAGSAAPHATVLEQAGADRLAALEGELESLRAQVTALRDEWAAFRKQFE